MEYSFVDMLIIAYGADADDDVIFYYAWDLGVPWNAGTYVSSSGKQRPVLKRLSASLKTSRAKKTSLRDNP
jgi:hypothetical protein